MNAKIKHLFLLGILVIGGAFVSVPSVGAAATCKGGGILTFPSWYRGLECDDDAKSNPKINALNDIWIVALNFLEILIGIAGYGAVGYIVWGGIRYVKSQGEPGEISGAKNTIRDAIIGLVIALAAVMIVRTIQGALL